MSERHLWRFILHPFEDDDASALDLGTIHAVGMDNAYMRGCAAFVAVGDNASDIAARRLGGKWKDYPDAFFTVEEI